MNKSDRIRLQHMLEAAEEAYSLAHAHSRDALDSERLLMLALIRLVEVVGEAANQISDTLQQEHSDIPWRDIVGMRNRSHSRILRHQLGHSLADSDGGIAPADPTTQNPSRTK